MNPMTAKPRFSQQGVSLVIVLVLLLVMTVLGLAVLRGTLLEERMTANLRDRSLSFQAAEAALREGETIAAAEPTPPPAGCSAAGVCAQPVAGEVDRWRNAGFGGWVTASSQVNTATTPTSYFIEYMGEAPTWPGCDRQVPVQPQCLRPTYRITARSTEKGRAQVLLQSNYIVR